MFAAATLYNDIYEYENSFYCIYDPAYIDTNEEQWEAEKMIP